MASRAGVLTVGERTRSGATADITFELMAVGLELSKQLGEPLLTAMMGATVQQQAKELTAYGADAAYAIEDLELDDLSNLDAQLVALEMLCQDVEPRIVLLGRTAIGRDIAPRLAFRLGTACACDCVELWVDQQTRHLMVNRPVYGGMAIATLSCDGEVQVATVRPGAFEPAQRNSDMDGRVIVYQPKRGSLSGRTRVVARKVGPVVALEGARIVIGGGRGVGSAEGFRRLEELAKLVGGVVGASRPACDVGWLDHSRQIGLTGKTIAPDLYVAVGISGAAQHMAGCSRAKCVVAVNKDPEASIFKGADFGVVGDWNKVLPAFVEQLQALRREGA